MRNVMRASSVRVSIDGRVVGNCRAARSACTDEVKKTAEPTRRPGAETSTTTRVEERIRSARDSLPGRRDALPKGALGGLPPDPQADENRPAPRNAPTIPP